MQRVGIALIVAVAALLPVSFTGAQQSGAEESVMERLIGSWSLVRFDSIDENGQATRRPYSGGRISYAAGGQMTAQVLPEGWAEGDESAGYIAYYGRYSVDLEREAIIHHVEGAYNRNMFGQAMPRYFDLSEDGNSLTLQTRNSEGRTTARLRWVRIMD